MNFLRSPLSSDYCLLSKVDSATCLPNYFLKYHLLGVLERLLTPQAMVSPAPGPLGMIFTLLGLAFPFILLIPISFQVLPTNRRNFLILLQSRVKFHMPSCVFPQFSVIALFTLS